MNDDDQEFDNDELKVLIAAAVLAVIFIGLLIFAAFYGC
jgi:membrane protein involved in colicin uptake